MILCPVLACAESIGFGWDANTESNLAGYKIYTGLSSRSYDSNIDVGNVTRYTMSGLAADMKYFFAVTAYDTTGNETGFSHELTFLFIENAPTTSTKVYIITK